MCSNFTNVKNRFALNYHRALIHVHAVTNSQLHLENYLACTVSRDVLGGGENSERRLIIANLFWSQNNLIESASLIQNEAQSLSCIIFC